MWTIRAQGGSHHSTCVCRHLFTLGSHTVREPMHHSAECSPHVRQSTGQINDSAFRDEANAGGEWFRKLPLSRCPELSSPSGIGKSVEMDTGSLMQNNRKSQALDDSPMRNDETKRRSPRTVSSMSIIFAGTRRSTADFTTQCTHPLPRNPPERLEAVAGKLRTTGCHSLSSCHCLY
jgi:hypothetical protein